MPCAPQDTRALIAIDLGAESCRVSLLRWVDAAPAISLVHRFANSPRETTCGLRWDLATIERGIHEGLLRAAEQAPEGIRSLAVDGWAVDYVRLDETGKAAEDPFCYRDERTLATERALHAILPAARIREITGVAGLRINTLYQLCADLSPVRKLRWINLPEYILYRLGARRPIAEFSNATHTQMIDLASGTWSGEILRVAGLDPGLFPEVVPSGSIVGEVTGSLAQLPAYAHTLLIAPAAHDTASAIAGIPAEGDEWAYISSGTWSLVGTLLKIPNNSAEACAGNFTNLGAAGGQNCFHKNINGMWLLRQSMEYWAAAGEPWTVPELVEASQQLAPPEARLDLDDGSLLLPGEMPVRILAQIAGRGLPVPDAQPPSIANLIFHSLAASYAKTLSEISLYSGKSLKRLYIVGGGSRNAYLNRLTAAATGLEVICGAQESSILGNFAVQLARLESREEEPLLQPTVSLWAAALSAASCANEPG